MQCSLIYPYFNEFDAITKLKVFLEKRNMTFFEKIMKSYITFKIEFHAQTNPQY